MYTLMTYDMTKTPNSSNNLASAVQTHAYN